MAPLYIWNIQFLRLEHAYHYRKAIVMNQHTTAENIRCAHSSFKAMRIGRTVKTDERWKNLKASLMYQLLNAKADQCPIFHSTLKSTTGRSAIEDANIEYWARGKDGTGLNMLGHLMMTLRDSLATKPMNAHNPPVTNPRPQNKWSPQTQRSHNPNTFGPQIRCYNCNERSHTADTCRLPSPVMCFSCNRSGHKKKFCPVTNPSVNA